MGQREIKQVIDVWSKSLWESHLDGIQSLIRGTVSINLYGNEVTHLEYLNTDSEFIPGLNVFYVGQW